VLVVGCVLLDEFLLVLGHIVKGVDRIGGAGGNASATVNAALRVHIHLSRRLEAGLVLLGMDAIGRADLDAEGVLDARVSNHISHDEFNLQNEMGTSCFLRASVRTLRRTGRDYDHARMCAGEARRTAEAGEPAKGNSPHDEDHTKL